MTYAVTFTVIRDGKTFTLTSNFAGCKDPAEAEVKAKQNYPGLKKVTRVVPAK